MSALAPLLERRMLLQLTSLQSRARRSSHASFGLRLGAAWHAAAAAAAVTAHPTARRRRLSCSAAPAARRAPAAAAAASSPASAERQPPLQPQQQPGGGDPPHVSVLLHEVMGFFDGMNVATYVDGTLGAAGHASEVLRRHPELTTLVGFDLDTTAHPIACARLQQAGAHVQPVIKPQLLSAGAAAASSQSKGSRGSDRSSSMALPELPPQPPAPPATAYIIHSNFGSLGQLLPQLQGGALVGGVDAMLLDLGMSSMQVDESERGFSFLRDGPLDMRMDASPGSSAPRSAEELVNTASEAELGSIFRELGEERYWKGIARRIVSAREEEPIRTTQQLVKVIGNPGGGGGRGGRGRGDAKQKHPATRVFQALRIAVNDELGSIARALPDAIDCLRPGGGRLAVITFHSLEDRIVKWAFRRAAGMAPSDEALPSYCVPFHTPLDQPLVRILTRRPVVPSEEEQAANSRSRSAKLRVVERL